MKVRNLLVLTFGKIEDRETRQVVGGLKVKYSDDTHVDTRYVCVARHVNKGDELDPNWQVYDVKTPKSGPPEPDGTTGAYLVFHYGLGMGMFTGFGETATARGQLLAGKLAAFTYDTLELKRLTKVCLLGCFAASDAGREHTALADFFCAALLAECKKRQVDPPRVAGWDDIITILSGKTKHPSANPELNTAENVGRKQVGLRENGALARTQREKKFVWVLEGGAYVKKSVAVSGWSDKTAYLPTNTGLTASITSLE